MQSYYDELGVSPSATTDEISAAFRQLAKKYHPDLNVGREHETRSAFVRVQKAFEILSDPGRRARYNEQYDEQFNSRSPWSSPPPPPIFEIQPLEEFQIHPSSLQPAITLPRIRRRLDPDLRKTMIFVGACIALAVFILLIAS